MVLSTAKRKGSNQQQQNKTIENFMRRFVRVGYRIHSTRPVKI